MSPYIRYGLVTLPQVSNAVAGAPSGDKSRYRDELLWQEYARHLYARVGLGPRWEPAPGATASLRLAAGPVAGRDGLYGLRDRGAAPRRSVVNQTRMWLASQWTVLAGAEWRDGEYQMSATCSTAPGRQTGCAVSGPPGPAAARPTASVAGRWRSERPALPELPAEQCLPHPGVSARGARPKCRRAGPSFRTDTRRSGGGPGGGEEQAWLRPNPSPCDPALRSVTDRPAVFVFDERCWPGCGCRQAAGLPCRDARRARAAKSARGPPGDAGGRRARAGLPPLQPPMRRACWRDRRPAGRHRNASVALAATTGNAPLHSYSACWPRPAPRPHLTPDPA